MAATTTMKTLALCVTRRPGGVGAGLLLVLPALAIALASAVALEQVHAQEWVLLQPPTLMLSSRTRRATAGSSKDVSQPTSVATMALSTAAAAAATAATAMPTSTSLAPVTRLLYLLLVIAAGRGSSTRAGRARAPRVGTWARR